ncbi:glycosyltransferase [Pseudomonas yamanorum]|jgi:glycosyltransferase involved in cell wall biosynthesis|uniref:Glycosyltransferase n=1 Tax=Pseudomonas yamanorum TaxID=515393 RepID=A0ABU1CNC8_9PSED|nr:glycosyltransferase [Pseudomonas yamanorum]MDR0188775.1 glycosyltransferase [Pseudomonas yamanorum]SDU02198.1 Glycosyl transferase family 2 [Pseudomonas yamanorum]
MTLLSVIIPTHNRAKYAVQSIRSILELSDDIQVVVCDSSPIDDISGQFLGEYPESRLKLVRSGQGISVVDNFNLGLRSADGDYLVFIGDDDFVSSEIVKVAAWAKSKHVDSLKFNFPALYYWDDFKHSTRGDSYFGTLHISPYDGGVVVHDLKGSMNYALDNFGGGVFNMPRAYAGMISSDLARRIERKYGGLFGGVSPDIYSSFLISNESQSCFLIDYPVIIPGASGVSTSGQSSSGGHYGKLRDNAHIAPFKDLVWDSRVPEFYSVPTVWSFSLLKAVEKVEESSGVSLNPNFGRLFLKCFVYFPRSYRETLFSFRKTCSLYGAGKMVGQLFGSVWGEFLWGASRIINRFRARHVTNTIEVVSGLNTSYMASQELGKVLKQRAVDIKLPD